MESFDSKIHSHMQFIHYSISIYNMPRAIMYTPDIKGNILDNRIINNYLIYILIQIAILQYIIRNFNDFAKLVNKTILHNFIHCVHIVKF